MKKIRWMHILAFGMFTVLWMLMLTGCKEEETEKVSKAYYVISEELDIQKTADKAQEILENAE